MNLARKTRHCHCSRGLLIFLGTGVSDSGDPSLSLCLQSAKLALSGCTVMCRYSCRNQSKHLSASSRFPFLAGEFN